MEDKNNIENNSEEAIRPYRVMFWGDGFMEKLYYVPHIPKVGEFVSFLTQDGWYEVTRVTHTYLIDNAPSEYQTDINVYLTSCKLNNVK